MKRRQYAGPRARAGVMKLVTGRRVPLGGGKATVRGVTAVFVPVALNANGRRALRKLFADAGVSWEVAESFGDAAPGRDVSRFGAASAFVLRHPTGEPFASLGRHAYCRSLTADVVRPDRGGFDGTKLAPRPRETFKGEPADVRETAEAFAARWDAACQWAEQHAAGMGDDEIDAVASAACDYLGANSSLPNDLGTLLESL